MSSFCINKCIVCPNEVVEVIVVEELLLNVIEELLNLIKVYEPMYISFE
jgi:hypothetical protein